MREGGKRQFPSCLDDGIPASLATRSSRLDRLGAGSVLGRKLSSRSISLLGPFCVFFCLFCSRRGTVDVTMAPLLPAYDAPCSRFLTHQTQSKRKRAGKSLTSPFVWLHEPWQAGRGSQARLETGTTVRATMCPCAVTARTANQGGVREPSQEEDKSPFFIISARRFGSAA